MTFLVQFAINIRARAILLVFEKFTRAYLFQIALQIMWLLIQKVCRKFILSDFQIGVSSNITLTLMPLIVTLKAWVYFDLSIALA